MSKEKRLTAKKFNSILLFTAGGIVIVILAVSIIFIRFLNQKSQEASNNSYIASSSNLKIESLAKLQEQYKSMGDLEGKVRKYLPEEKDVTQLLRDLEGMSVKNKLSLQMYQVVNNKTTQTVNKTAADDMQLEKVGDFLVLPIQLELVGSFTGVDNVVKDVENYGRLVQIRNISYEKMMDMATANTDSVQATLKIDIYLKK